MEWEQILLITSALVNFLEHCPDSKQTQVGIEDMPIDCEYSIVDIVDDDE